MACTGISELDFCIFKEEILKVFTTQLYSKLYSTQTHSHTKYPAKLSKGAAPVK